MMGKDHGPGGDTCFLPLFMSALTKTKAVTKIMREVVTSSGVIALSNIIFENKYPVPRDLAGQREESMEGSNGGESFGKS